MTKPELQMALRAGWTLNELLSFGPGQDCEIFKADSFSAGDEIIYVPDIFLNEIHIDRPITDPDEVSSVLAYCYTGKDFLDECKGNLELAERLFWYCDWQHPSSAIDEVWDEEEDG